MGTIGQYAWLGVACGAAAFLLLLDDGARFVLAAIAGAAVLCAMRAPTAGVLVASVAQLVAWWFGVSTENPALLPAVVVTTFVAGRHGRTAPGVVAVGVLVAVTWAATGFEVFSLVFGAVMLVGTWGFGRVVRSRAESARAAGAEAARLAAHDPQVEAARVVRAERRRLAADSVAVVRAAVVDMVASAERARGDLAVAELTSIQRRGAEAVADLRRLLGLLRADPAAGLSDHAASAPEGRRPAPGDWLASVIALLLLPLDGLVSETQSGPVSWTLAVVVCIVPFLLRLRASAAAVLYGAVPLASLATGAPLLLGFGLMVVTVVVAWRVGSTRDWRLAAALAVFLAARVVDLTATEPGNIPMELTIAVLPVVVGFLWQGRDREFRAAQEEAAEHHRVQDGVVSEAVVRERVRIARELHDVMSHAVGVMVLHSAAASAQRERDPEQARASLALVESAGREALTELAVLAEVIDPGADAPEAAVLRADLESLADRMSSVGLAVTLSVAALPVEDRVAATVHRTVQEALTNVVRHAPGAEVTVRVDIEEGRWVVDVLNSAPPGPAGEGHSEGSGFGLVGVAERVRALGGDVAAGPLPDGGFAVKVRIPMSPVGAEGVR